MKIKLMAHLISGYPNNEASFNIAKAFIDGGADILEIQLPFSDPTADGKAIEEACAQVLKRNYKTQEGFDLIKKINQNYKNTQIFLMTYASIIITTGIENFIKNAKEAGVSGIIVPDLPFDCDENLREIATKNGIISIPVAAPSMTKERRKKLLDENFQYIYTALRSGITGQETTINNETLDFINEMKSKGAKILGGFGISSKKQAQILAPNVYAIVAGSVFVRIISKYDASKIDEIYEAIKHKTKEFSH